MADNELTDRIAIAARFVNSTASHIFLTGKAGTGKTTFLHGLAGSTHKRLVIVAPTGIAALNAKGVTIHSQFLLPLGTFVPERSLPPELEADSNVYSQGTLARKHPLNSPRRKVLRDIDLLVIDEVSMLRADILDAIDYRLRSVKGNFRLPFGGVQLLMIGDPYQLPPVVRDNERGLMGRYYRSPHFFEARALQQSGFVYIELDRIFRQQDAHFIGLLNNFRNNTVTQRDLDTLNSLYRPDFRPKEDERIITLTTHNHQADRLNRAALDRLPGPSHFFEAELEGEFPEGMFPVMQRMELKVGAQVMFVKNDTVTKVYFNGMLATVHRISDDGDVQVRLDGSGERYTLSRETWENKRYTLEDKSKDLKEEVIGTFTQFPIKLAWAITVHKSQGLTFDRAIIDVGSAFAPGQVYVALSRLRSLEGLILRTRIDPSVVSTDPDVVEFSKKEAQQGELSAILTQRQADYLRQLLTDSFDFSSLIPEINKVHQDNPGIAEFEDESMRSALDVLSGKLKEEDGNTARFRSQLLRLLQADDRPALLERIAKGSEYYRSFLKERIAHIVLHQAEVAQFSRTKTYLNALSELDLGLMKKLGEVEKALHVARCMLEGSEVTRQPAQEQQRTEWRLGLVSELRQKAAEHPKASANKSGKSRKKADSSEDGPKKPKPPRGETCRTTWALLREGKSAEEAAKERGLALSTIEGHALKGIQQGELDISAVMEVRDMLEIAKAIEASEGTGNAEVYSALGGRYSFDRIRMVRALREKLEEKERGT